MAKEPKVEHPAARDVRSPMKTWRILFLDHLENIEQLKGACKDMGYTVAGAVTIEEAWAFLDGKDHVDVIVCAPHLKEESVFEFVKAVRESEHHRATKILILALKPSQIASRLHQTTGSTAVALGADTYAIMPTFDANELIALIQKLQPLVPVLQQYEEKAPSNLKGSAQS